MAADRRLLVSSGGHPDRRFLADRRAAARVMAAGPGGRALSRTGLREFSRFMSTLIITNGDTAAEKMREGRINGEILCWRDVLHEGPVPRMSMPEELSPIRADYLAWRGWRSEER